MAKEYGKRLPDLTDETRPYWESCKKHELRMQKCLDCGYIRPYPPCPICPNCGSLTYEWHTMNGKGTIYTFSVVHNCVVPVWRDEVPYVVAVVDLDEGARIQGNTVGCKPEDVRIGKRVQVVFDDVTDTVSMPKFQLI